jgi:hypothetical protein
MARLFLILFLVPSVVLAEDFEKTMASMSRAQELGAVLGSEKLCDLTLDQAGIEAWIAANVASDDMSFATNLQTMTMGQEFQQQSMTASSKTAHCAAVRQSAQTMGLIK